MLTGLLLAAALVAAPTSADGGPFQPAAPNPKVQKRLERVADKANGKLAERECAAFFADQPDDLPPQIEIEAGYNSDPTTLAWSQCEAYPASVFLALPYMDQLTVKHLAQLAIHEAAHLAQCSTVNRTLPSEREAVAIQAERACYGKPLLIRVTLPE